MNIIRNIPGLWTSLFHWGGYMFFILMLPKKTKTSLICFISAVILVVQTTLYVAFIADRSGSYFNIMSAVFALWTLLPFFLFMEGKWTNRVYYCARGYILGAFTAAFSWQFYKLSVRQSY